MNTLNWIGRLLIWPLIVLLDVLGEEVRGWYFYKAFAAVSAGIFLLVFACVAAFVPLWPLPSPFTNTVAVCMSTLFYFTIGLIFYFENPESMSRIGGWQRNGPW